MHTSKIFSASRSRWVATLLASAGATAAFAGCESSDSSVYRPAPRYTPSTTAQPGPVYRPSPGTTYTPAPGATYTPPPTYTAPPPTYTTPPPAPNAGGQMACGGGKCG